MLDDYWGQVKADVERYSANLYTIVDGDLADMGVRFTPQVITTNQAVILRMGIDTFLPVADISQKLFIIRGTEAHVGGSGWLEEKMACDLKAERCADTNTNSWWHLIADFGGALFDVAHHGSIGRLPWTMLSALGETAAKVIIECAKYKWRTPDIAVRAHCHRKGDSLDHYPVRVIQLLALQLMPAYAYRNSTDALSDIGGAIGVIRKGQLDVRIVTYKPSRGRIWHG